MDETVVQDAPQEVEPVPEAPVAREPVEEPAQDVATDSTPVEPAAVVDADGAVTADYVAPVVEEAQVVCVPRPAVGLPGCASNTCCRCLRSRRWRRLT